MRQLTPHHAWRRNLTVDGYAIAALDTAPDEMGDTVLLVPGYTGSKEDFATVLDPISAAGYRALAIDLPGHNDSAGPSDPAAYTMKWLGGVIQEIAAQLGGGRQVSVVGHSVGGLVSRAAVIAEPARFANLTLIGSGPAKLQGAFAETVTALEPLIPLGKGVIYQLKEKLSQYDPRTVDETPEMKELLRGRFMKSSLAALQGTGWAAREEPDRVAELAATGVPVLVCTGAEDYGWPPEVQSDMAERLNAEQVIITGAEHSPMLEQPAATLAALHDFWRRHGPVELASRGQ